MNRRIIIVAAIVLILSFIGIYSLSVLMYRSGKTHVTMPTSSQGAVITINSRVVNSSEIYLKPGKYMVSAIKNGYYEFRKIYEIKDKNINLSIKLSSIPDKTVSESEFSGDFNALKAEYPIISNLPYEDPLYLLDYNIKGSYLNGYLIEIIIISDSAVGRRAALQGIKDLGYNPIDYWITFLNFEVEVK